MFGFLGAKANDIKACTIQEIICLVLAQGQSSRLYQELIEKKKDSIFNVIASDYYHFKDGGNLLIEANFKPENKEEAIAQIKEQIEKICAEGITEQELKKAKKKLKAGFAENSETISDIAENIGFYMTVCDGLERVQEYMQTIENITLEEVNSSIKDCIDVSRAVISVLLPEQN